MAFIDVVEWSPRTNDIYAWKYPHENLSTSTQLLVRESQEAVFFSKGRIIGKFGPGKHILSTENLPLLRNLFGIPFGGKNPFLAEVWFVNKAMPLTIDWRTTSMRIMDPVYGAMVPIVAMGRYGLQVQDAEKFLVKLVGTLTEFNAAQLTDHFMGPLIAKTNSVIVSYMTANRVSITEIAAHLDELGTFLSQPMAEFWEDYGLRLTGFYITSVDIDMSTAEGRKISEAISDRSAQNIAGYTWQQKQTFGMANNAVGKGGSMGLLGMAMLGGAFGSGGGGFAQGMMQQPSQTGFNTAPGQGGYPQQGSYPQQGGYQQGGYPQQGGMTPGVGGPAAGPIHARKEVFCAHCGRKFSADMSFCPNCGHRYNPCPVCGADNDEGTRRCVSCGATLSGAPTAADLQDACPRCGAPYKPGTKFCPHCGQRLG